MSVGKIGRQTGAHARSPSEREDRIGLYPARETESDASSLGVCFVGISPNQKSSNQFRHSWVGLQLVPYLVMVRWEREATWVQYKAPKHLLMRGKQGHSAEQVPVSAYDGSLRT